MSQKIYIIGADQATEENQLVSAIANNSGLLSEMILLKDLTVSLGKTTKFLYQGKDFFKALNGNEKFIIRRSRGFYPKLVLFCQHLQEKNLTFTDSLDSVTSNLNKYLSLPAIESELFPHPPHTFFTDADSKNLDLKDSDFPILTKPIYGRHGDGIYIHENASALQQAIQSSNQPLIAQACLDIDYEFRIFVIGDQALGAIRKTPAPGNQIANYAAGAKFEIMHTTEAQNQEAIKLCQHQGIDIGGVDVAKTKSGEFYILEVNRCPEFKAFSEATGIDIAQAIIEFLLKK